MSTIVVVFFNRLYLLGFEPKVSALYPAIQFPVPRDTPSLQPFTTWDHSETYGLPAHLVKFQNRVPGYGEPPICSKHFRTNNLIYLCFSEFRRDERKLYLQFYIPLALFDQELQFLAIVRNSIEGLSTQPRFSFAVFENFRLYIIFLEETKLTSFFEVFA